MEAFESVVFEPHPMIGGYRPLADLGAFCDELLVATPKRTCPIDRMGGIEARSYTFRSGARCLQELRGA